MNECEIERLEHTLSITTDTGERVKIRAKIDNLLKNIDAFKKYITK